jgi:outer membrane protein with beta-barrel domain
MKKSLRASLMLTLFLATTSIYAQGQGQGISLGQSNWGFKVDYFSFTDSAFQNANLGNGVYLGLEGYGAVAPNLYLGGEVGWAGPSNEQSFRFLGRNINLQTDLTYVPVEVNLKYAIQTSPQLVFDLGGGFSFNYINASASAGAQSIDENDWVWGGQIFGDMTYKLGNQWYLGLNAKYQATQDITVHVRGTDVETDTSASNWRIGGQIGMTF